MMLPITCFAESPVGTREQGVSLIEAMVAVLILAILFLGMAHVLARGLVSQRYVNTQNLALLEMREVLQAGVCTGTPSLSLIENMSLQANCPDRANVTISVGALSPVTLTGSDLAPVIQVSTPSNTTSQGLFGGDGVITVSSN